MSGIASANFTGPIKIGKGRYPTIAQDENGMYWLVFNNESGIYMMNSSDLANWSLPEKLPFSQPDDYDAYLRIYDGKFYIAFTRHKLVNPHSLFGFDYDVYLAIGDGKNWKLVPINTSNSSVDWYPYIYRDPFGKFWLVYSKDYKDGNGSTIVVRYSDDAVNWSREYPAIPPSSLFGSMFYFKDRYWMVYALYTGNYTIPEIMNLHDLYIAYSFDGINWVRAAKLTNTPPPYNFTLYVDAETDGKNIWVSYTSTIEGNEEVYIFGSPDGFNWSEPVRLSRNIEYIRSLENPYNFKCDQKDLLIDEKGKAIVVYQSAIFPNATTLWIVYGKPVTMKGFSKAEYNITLPYRYSSEKNPTSEKENSKKTPLGAILPLIALGSALLTARIAKKKNG
ncbi:hypothetical protein GACE_1848 [Geoglobus acetivorans]|uniref:Uncharacterized protein n=1 Tax=Geoglobus acetivorans TaxID=565033 RepID=A0A0A7GFN7_GEOAI|nr:hypothetical protein GACE_1848 [Geoglobus acetivorans]